MPEKLLLYLKWKVRSSGIMPMSARHANFEAGSISYSNKPSMSQPEKWHVWNHLRDQMGKSLSCRPPDRALHHVWGRAQQGGGRNG